MSDQAPRVPPVQKVAPPPTGKPRPLPKELWVVRFIEGHGYPECTDRTHKIRRFDRDIDAARFIAALAKWPTHHTLLDVHKIVPLGTFQEVDPAHLPPVITVEDEDDSY